MANTRKVPSSENNVVEEGVDRSRPQGVPEGALIGGGGRSRRMPEDKARQAIANSSRTLAAQRQAREQAEDDRPQRRQSRRQDEEDTIEVSESADTEVETDDDQGDFEGGDDFEHGDERDDEDDVVLEAEQDAGDLTDDELMDLLLAQDGGGVPQVEIAAEESVAAAPKPGKIRLSPELTADYRRAVERYGKDVADEAVLPGLIREQRLNDKVNPLLEGQKRQQEQADAEAEQKLVGFFEAKAKAGFAPIYGTDIRKASNAQKLAAQRVLAKAINIRQIAATAGLVITPESALERAHKAIFGNTDIARKVGSRQQTMQKRADSTTMPTPRGDARGAGGGNRQADPYDRVRKALRKGGYTNR